MTIITDNALDVKYLFDIIQTNIETHRRNLIMASIDLILAIVACILFFLAGFNVPAAVRWEWLAAAVLTLTLVI